MSYLNLADDGRVLSAQGMPETKTAVKNLPDGNLYDYKYIDGKFVLDPLPKEEPSDEPTAEEKLEAQVVFTAMMTDTLLPEETEGE